ncbi:BrnA antitoxin family protein [Methylobacterium sp. J-088]|uniref:BrnA antitoxin family protein n=1 Tax=unclassified Methylobacterium TaxID=2615210 RepID=UPI001FB89AA5|nr:MULTISPECIES: BrnA antitoxin family protein [unclassified Methylobacterium]MCJ2065074.1 BrnA antitoxin family protein [Methylobacterium sp. J-088]
MAEDRNRRRFTDPRAAAEAAFRAATSPKPEAPPQQAAPRTATPPGTRETVSLRLDSAVLAHFQKDGPGWQDRINAALKTLIPAAQD